MSNLSLNKFEPLLITAVNIAARAVHLVFFIAIGNKYGSTALTDNVIALLAPLVVLTSVTTGAADTVVMPVFHRAKNKDEAAYIYRFFSKRIVVYVSLLSLVICFASSLLYKNNNKFLILILFLIPVFAALSALKAGVLNASNRFQAAVTGPLFGAAAATFFLFITPLHIYSFASSFLIFEAGKMAWLSFFKDVSSGGISKKTDSSEKVIRWGYRNTKIQLLASFIMALIYPVDIWFAQSIKEVGAVTFVEYANKLWNIVPLLFTGHIAVTYASLSKTASVSEEAFNKKIDIHSIALRYLFWGTITGILIIFASDYFVSLLFGFGKITVQQQNVLSDLLKSYLIGSGFYIGGLVYVRALSAAGRIDILLVITSFSFIYNILSDFILIRILGINGIGIATSLVYTCNFFLLIFFYEKNRLAV